MIENDEIFLSEITQEDRNFYCEIYTNNQLMEFVVDPLSIESANKSFNITFDKMSATPKKLLLFVIKSKKGQKRLGVIGLRWNQHHPQHVEIGIIVLEKFQRQGVGHATKSLLIEHAFNNLNVIKIVAICDKDNVVAICANKKLGFKCVEKSILNNKSKTIWEKTK